MNDEKDNLVVEKKKNRHSFSLIRILFLIFLLMGNTLAWFIYVTRIDNSVSVHVKAWDVVFQDGEDEVSICELKKDNWQIRYILNPKTNKFEKQVIFNNGKLGITSICNPNYIPFQDI